MKKILAFVSVFALGAAMAFSQAIVTASDFFKNISDYYETISDYEAEVEFTRGKTVKKGTVSFKRPELLHMELDTLDDSDKTVVNYDGSTFQIYIQGLNAILTQQVSSASQGSVGLSLIRRYYTVAYETGADPVPLDENDDRQVIKLECFRRSNTESFKSIVLSIDPVTKLIVRAYAETNDEVFILDFLSYQLNTKMSEQRFIYTPPANANEYSNFLFEE